MLITVDQLLSFVPRESEIPNVQGNINSNEFDDSPLPKVGDELGLRNSLGMSVEATCKEIIGPVVTASIVGIPLEELTTEVEELLPKIENRIVQFNEHMIFEIARG